MVCSIKYGRQPQFEISILSKELLSGFSHNLLSAPIRMLLLQSVLALADMFEVVVAKSNSTSDALTGRSKQNMNRKLHTNSRKTPAQFVLTHVDATIMLMLLVIQPYSSSRQWYFCFFPLPASECSNAKTLANPCYVLTLSLKEKQSSLLCSFLWLHGFLHWFLLVVLIVRLIKLGLELSLCLL